MILISCRVKVSSSSDVESPGFESYENSSSSSSERNSDSYPKGKNHLKAKMVCQFFFSSVEGDFSCPIPVRQMNSAKLKNLVWKVIEVLSKTFVNGQHIQVLYGVCDGTSHVKLNARTKMSVKRAVEVCSEDVVTDICQGSFFLEDTIGTRMYLCARLFKIMNNSTEIDPSSYRDLVKILRWFTGWYNEIKITMPEKGQHKAHWKNSL